MTNNWWIEAFGLYDSDKEILISQSELIDNIINAAQILLGAQFPSIGEFQSIPLKFNFPSFLLCVQPLYVEYVLLSILLLSLLLLLVVLSVKSFTHAHLG